MNIQEIISAVEGMTILELADLVRPWKRSSAFPPPPPLP